MVVVRVCPPWRVDLPRRHACRTHGIHHKDGLLPAAAISSAVEGFRRDRPDIVAVIRSVFRRPAVDFQRALLLCLWLFRSFIQTTVQLLSKQLPARPDLLIVDTVKQNILPEEISRECRDLASVLSQPDAAARKIQVHLSRVHHHIRDRHPGIQKFQRHTNICIQSLQISVRRKSG